MKNLILILFFCFAGFCGFAQTDTGKAAETVDTAKHPPLTATVKKFKKRLIADTTKKNKVVDSLKKSFTLTNTDSIVPSLSDSAKISRGDSIKHSALKISIKRPIDSFYLKLLDNPFIKTNAKPIYLIIDEKENHSKDENFYLLCGLLLFLAFIKLVFSRYFKNLFKLFFEPSFRQKQTREQLSQNNLPSLLLNLFFIFSAATYVSFLLQYYHLVSMGYWYVLLYTAASLLILYAGKFILLSFTGWIFDVKEATGAYIFAVYLINKILGVILIPFTLLIAFAQPLIISISITISLLIILLLYIYRYLVSFAPVRKEVKVSVLHFFLYICAFEIIPLLVIYKTLIIYLDKSL